MGVDMGHEIKRARVYEGRGSTRRGKKRVGGVAYVESAKTAYLPPYSLQLPIMNRAEQAMNKNQCLP